MRLVVRLFFSLLILILSACGTMEITVDRTPTADVAATGTVAALRAQNAALQTQIAGLGTPQALFTPIPPTLTSVTAEPATARAPGATRITFLQGATVGVVSAPIEAGRTQEYVLQAFRAQPMFAYVASVDSDVTLSIKRQDGTTILSAADHKISWQGTLPETEDYYLTIHGGALTENFSLTVTVPSRIEFAEGAESATVSGQTVGGYGVSYTLFAGKGQKMRVDLDEFSSKASLSIYGFTDGEYYLRSDRAQTGYQFVLPMTQDYIIVIIPASGRVVRYTMTVKVQ